MDRQTPVTVPAGVLPARGGGVIVVRKGPFQDLFHQVLGGAWVEIHGPGRVLLGGGRLHLLASWGGGWGAVGGAGFKFLGMGRQTAVTVPGGVLAAGGSGVF